MGFSADGLTTRPLALVAEWLGQQHEQPRSGFCCDGILSQNRSLVRRTIIPLPGPRRRDRWTSASAESSPARWGGRPRSRSQHLRKSGFPDGTSCRFAWIHSSLSQGICTTFSSLVSRPGQGRRRTRPSRSSTDTRRLAGSSHRSWSKRNLRETMDTRP